jgi:hypothetical protein
MNIKIINNNNYSIRIKKFKYLNIKDFKENIKNYFFIRYFLNENFQILSRTDTKLKKKIHKKISKNILKLRQKKILQYSI